MDEKTIELEKVTLNFKRDGDTLIIQPVGRIESANAAKVEAAVQEELHDINAVQLDCEKLEYISSAGLRIILRIKKTYDKVSAVNVSNEVYEIF